MSETVRTVKHPWLVGIAVAAIGAAYFLLLGTSRHPEPGVALEYNLAEFEALDRVEPGAREASPIALTVDNPRALAAASGKVYVAGKDAVAVFDETDREVSRFAVAGTPNCLAATADGTLYVGLSTKVCVLDASGKLRAEWTAFTPRSFLTSIAVVGPNVFIADAGNRVVYRFDLDGKLQAKIGQKDPSRDIPGLEVPSPYLDLAVNSDGDLWVVNPGKLGLEQYRPDGSIVTSWYRPSVTKLEGFPGCCNPTQIAFTSKDELITCEKGLVRIKRYEVTAGGFEDLLAGSTLFPREQSVRDIAVDSKDRILVLDPQRNSVRVFVLKEKDHDSGSKPT